MSHHSGEGEPLSISYSFAPVRILIQIEFIKDASTADAASP
jgi:hypothetical protein